MGKSSAFFVFFFILLILFAILPAPAQAAQAENAYDQLPSEELKEVYRILDDSFASLTPVIVFPEDMEIYSYDLSKVVRAVCVDHPEYFWFLEYWFYDYEAEISMRRVTSLRPTYFLDGERISASSQELADATVAFHQKVNEIITGIPVDCVSQYDIALYLHDYLIDHVTYSLEGNHDSAYFALVHGQAACYGYSKAYQYLLNAAGVRAQTITGKALDQDGNQQGHAWNLVWIDGVCYYTDVTWDDWDFTGIHAYFLTSLESFSRDHIADANFTLPECDHALNYHEISSGYGVADLSSKSKGEDASQHFALVSQNGKTATFACEMRFDGNFISWMNNHSWEIIRDLGLSRYTTIEYYYSDDVFYVIMVDPNYTVPDDPIKSITQNLTEVTLTGIGAQAKLQAETVPAYGQRELIFASSDESVAVVTDSGMIRTTGTGTATVTVSSADGKIYAACSVTVAEGETHTHSLRKIITAEPSCTQDGSDSYFRCTTCGCRFFDEEATQLITSVKDIARPATGHQNLSWKTDRRMHVKVCSCSDELDGTYGMHADADKNQRCDVCNHPIASIAADNVTVDKVVKIVNIVSIVIGAALVAGIAIIIFLIRRRR